MYLPGASAGPITGVAVNPPGQSTPPPRPPGVSVNVLSNLRFHSCVPLATSTPYRLSEMPATTAISFGPSVVVTSLTINGGNRLCIWRGWLSSCSVQASFMFLTVSFLISVSLRCQAFFCGSPPSVSQLALPGVPCTGAVPCARGDAIQLMAKAPATSAHVCIRPVIEELLEEEDLKSGTLRCHAAPVRMAV